jgi:hypothetical protein
LDKNIGFSTMKYAAQILDGTTLHQNSKLPILEQLTLKEIGCLKYCLITSCDVERSFSIYKNIFTDRRTSFTMENLEQYIVVHYYLNHLEGFEIDTLDD